MKHIHYPEQINIEMTASRVVVLGKFEPVHLGHRKLLERGRELADTMDAELVVMLFSERKHNNFFSLEERMMFINEYRPDYILEFEPSSRNFSNTYLKFNDYLASLSVNAIVAGNDFRYGKDREGSIDTLKERFDVLIVDEVMFNSVPIKTSNVMDALAKDDLETYKNMMGHYFFYKGKVVRGLGNGKKFGMPTANVEYPEYKLNVNEGIYYSYVIYDGKRMPSLTSISKNPTLDAEEVTYETYIYDFDKDIYDEEIYVELIEKYREPIKFDSIEELVAKLEEDKILGKKFFNLV